MGYSKHSLPRLGRCCVPLRGIATPPPVPPACKLWTACPAARLRLFKIRFCTYPERVAATDQNNRPRRGGSVRLCAALCAVFRACLVWIFPDQSGDCAGAVRRHGGREKAKEKPPTAGRLWPYLFIFKSSARTTNGKAMIQRATSIFSPPQTNVNRFAVVVLVNLSAMAGAFFFNAVVSIRELVTVL